MFVDGSESDADLGALKELGAVMVLLKIAPSLSRVHATRRVFEQLQQQPVGGGRGAWGGGVRTSRGGCCAPSQPV